MTRESDLRRQREAKFAAKPKPGPEYLGRPTTDCRTSFPVDDIRIGERHRKDMGDLAGLAANDGRDHLAAADWRPAGRHAYLGRAPLARRWPAQIATGWDLKVFSPPLMGDGTNAQRGCNEAGAAVNRRRASPALRRVARPVPPPAAHSPEPARCRAQDQRSPRCAGGRDGWRGPAR